MREFRMKGSRDQWKVWRIGTEGAEIHTEWGVLGGKQQSTIDVAPAVFVGKANELSPTTNAIEEVKRKIKKKTDEGYAEFRDGKPLYDVDQFNGIDWNRGLPKQFCGYKPLPQPDPEKKSEKRSYERMKDVLESGRAIITIKDDGFKHWVMVTADGGVQIFTSGMDECTEKYPHLVESFRTKNSSIPTKSLMCCELTVLLPDGKCNRLAMQAISNSLPKRARALQQDPTQRAEATVLSILFWNGIDVFSNFTFGEIIEFLEEQFGMPSRCPPFVRGMEVYYDDFAKARLYVEEKGLEGLVIYDSTHKPGERSYNFRGKPQRPDCWKWKPEFEDDFFVVFDPNKEFGWDQGGKFGRGRSQDRAGRICLYQKNDRGDYVYCSGCGTGLSHNQRMEVVNRALEGDGLAGVAEIKFVTRRYLKEGDGSNALVEPRFIRWRDDKDVEEIVNSLL